MNAYRWHERYDGSLNSLKDKSRKPHYHPNQHTEAELREAGYTRTVQELYHVLQRLGIYKKTPSKKKESEPSEWVTGTYPGEKFQVDVKHVPKKCMSPELQEMGEKYYQYTGIDEFTNRLSWQAFTKNKKTLFEKTLEELEIEYKVIKPHTPKQNGEQNEVIGKIKKGFIITGYFVV